MSYWGIIVPASTINYVVNPSFEGATSATPLVGWNGGSRLTVSSASAIFGNNAAVSTYKKEQSGSLVLVSASIASLTLQPNTEYVFSAHVYTEPNWTGGTLFVGGSEFTAASQNRIVTYGASDRGTWKRISSSVTLDSDASGLFHISFDTPPTDSQSVVVDGVQVEKGERITTYCDDQQPGCWLLGYKGTSPAIRGEDEPTGGYEYSFANDLALPISEAIGLGAAPPINQFQPQGLNDGVNYQGTKLAERMNIVLAGTFNHENEVVNKKTYHSSRAKVIRALNSRVGSLTSRSGSLRTLTYTGAKTPKQFSAVYSGGMEMVDKGNFVEQVALKFVAPEPYVYSRTGNSKKLNTRQNFTSNGIVAKINDSWQNLGISSTTGLYNVLAIASDDEHVYMGGRMTGINGGAINHLFRYNYRTGVVSAVGGNPNNYILCAAVAPDGKLYVGGLFTEINGVPAAGFAVWDGSTWSAVGGITTYAGAVRGIAFDSQGRVWIVGEFNNFAGIAAADKIARLSGSTWSAVGTGLNSDGLCIEIDSLDNVYIGGWFTTAGSTPANYIAKWDDANGYTAMGSGLNSAGEALAIADDGSVYVGGTFTTAGGVSANRLARWNGVTFEPVGANNINGGVFGITAVNGLVYISGAFSSVDGLTLLQRAAVWNGSTWSNLDFDLSGTPTGYKVHINRIGQVFFGYGTSGALSTNGSGQTDITYSGTEVSYPVIEIDNQQNNNFATVINITNILTGAVIYMNYRIPPGDFVAIDFRPGQRGITSKKSGNKTGNFLSNSDVANFFLSPSNRTEQRINKISMFVTGAPANVVIKWRDTFNGIDD
jgi:hypothetical protein